MHDGTKKTEKCIEREKMIEQLLIDTSLCFNCSVFGMILEAKLSQRNFLNAAKNKKKKLIAPFNIFK